MPGVSVLVRIYEPIDNALEVLKDKGESIFSEVRKRAFYERPAEKRKRKFITLKKTPFS